MPWNWPKIEIYDINQYGCSPEKVFLYEVELFWKPFVPNTWIYFFKAYFHYTGWKIPWNRLKTEIYDFNQYSCSLEKVFICEVETFWSLLSKYIWIFRIWYSILFCLYLRFLISYRNVYVLQMEIWIPPFKWHTAQRPSILIAREIKQTMWHIQIDAILLNLQNTPKKQCKKLIKGKLSGRKIPIL